MSWNGRSSLPALAGAVEAVDGPVQVTFATPFHEVPTVTPPSTVEGVTVTVSDVTETGFVLTVDREPDAESTPVEWVATTAAPSED